MAKHHATPETVLVYVGLDLVGDALIKLPFVRALRHAYPEARITWLAGKGKSAFGSLLRPLVEGLLDEVVDDAGIGTDLRHLIAAPLDGTCLAGRHFDLVIDTQTRVKTSLIVRRIPHQVMVSGALGFLLSDRRPAFGYCRPQALVQRLLDMVEIASGRPPEAGLSINLDPDLHQTAAALLPTGPTYVGISPGASLDHKRWPLDRFISLARRQVERGRVPVFLLGPKELAWSDRLAEAVPEALQPETALGQDSSPLLTIALAGRLTAAVANDSGTSHMLAAADTPLVSLFGPTSPEKFAPYTSRGVIVTAQQFGASDAMTAIPLEAAAETLESFLSELAETKAGPGSG